MRFNHVTLDISDLERSKAFYSALGLVQIVEEAPRYARFVFPEGDATLSVEVTPADAETSSSRATLFFECDALDEKVAELRTRGLVFEMEPTDMFYLWREAWLRDPDGHAIRLYRAGENRLNPPWRLPESVVG